MSILISLQTMKFQSEVVPWNQVIHHRTITFDYLFSALDCAGAVVIFDSSRLLLPPVPAAGSGLCCAGHAHMH